MSKKQVTQKVNYRTRLEKTPEEVQNEQMDSHVEQANIAMKMGLLSMESKISTANGEVLKAETNVANAQKDLDDAKSSSPGALVQNLINAHGNLKQCKANLVAVKQDLADLKALQAFLIETQAELF